MAHRQLRDVEADGWERSDFPIICETCLGDNPFVRMTKAQFDKECKICTRPFTVFRWRPGRDARYKKTEICQTCSKLKNVCQVCLLDLEYGLPVQVRDQALGVQGEAIPTSEVNREYFAEQAERNAQAGLDFDSSYGKARPNDTILKLQRTQPYYKRNRAHICSFYVKGECTRGAECPFRHEMPVTGELAHQNIKDRYYGTNDPVARKLLNKASEMPSLVPPDDETITTLYIGGVPADDLITEADLRGTFATYGEIRSVRIIANKGCAFVAFMARVDAEKAADELVNKLVIKGHRLKLMWGRPQQPRTGDRPANTATNPPANLLPRQVQQADAPIDYFNLPPPAPLGGERPFYPSMDPRALGSKPVREADTEKEPNSNPPQSQAGPPPQWQPQPGQYQFPPYGAPPMYAPCPPMGMYPGGVRPPPPRNPQQPPFGGPAQDFAPPGTQPAGTQGGPRGPPPPYPQPTY